MLGLMPMFYLKKEKQDQASNWRGRNNYKAENWRSQMATNWKTQVAVTQVARQNHRIMRKNVFSCSRFDGYGENKGRERNHRNQGEFEKKMVEGECWPLKCQATTLFHCNEDWINVHAFQDCNIIGNCYLS